MAEHESDRDSPLEVRVYRMDMMASIHEQGSVDLTLYDVAILSELVRRTFPHPSVVVAFLAAMNKALDTPKPELDNV